MPKDEVLRRIDQRSPGPGGTVASPARPATQGLGNADMVDGIDASRVPAPNVLLALNARGKFPASVIEGALADEWRGSWGRVVLGPTTFLAEDVNDSQGFIRVQDQFFGTGTYVYLSLGAGVTEIMRIDDDGQARNGYFEYAVTRGADGGPALEFEAGTSVIGVGAAGEGYMVDVAMADDGPYRDMFTRESDSATDVVHRLRIGNLRGILGIAETLFGLAVGDLRDGSREYLLVTRRGIDLRGGNIVGYDHDGNPCWGIFSRDEAIPGVGDFAAGDAFFGWPGTAEAPRGNVVIQGGLGRVVFRTGLRETMVIDGEAQTLLGLMYIGRPLGPAIVLDGGKQIRARNADGVDGFVVRAGTDADPNELFIQIGWPDPYSPKIILTNAGLRIDAEALQGNLIGAQVSVERLSDLSSQGGTLTQLSMGGNPINDVGMPTVATDAANKEYVDGLAATNNFLLQLYLGNTACCGAAK